MSEQSHWERSPNYQAFFSNAFRLRFTVGDANITFAQFMETPGADQQNNILEHMNVTMSWPQLKMLAEYMNVAVQEMEREVGPIPRLAIPREELRENALAIIRAFTIYDKKK